MKPNKLTFFILFPFSVFVDDVAFLVEEVASRGSRCEERAPALFGRRELSFRTRATPCVFLLTALVLFSRSFAVFPLSKSPLVLGKFVRFFPNGALFKLFAKECPTQASTQDLGVKGVGHFS